MHIWHRTPDAPRIPHRVIPGETVVLRVGTWPIESGQTVRVDLSVDDTAGKLLRHQETEAHWRHNEGENSYWEAEIGPFERGQRVGYAIHGTSPSGDRSATPAAFQVGPRIHLAILWHQHQPIYKDASRETAHGSYVQPWVRLHAIRDYYSMAAIVGRYPNVHATINLTPALLTQIEDYVDRGASDRAMDLALKSAETLGPMEREEILSEFFDAHWHNQIYPHARYKELFMQRRRGEPFAVRDVRDLQMWFNLAWFAKEFRDGEIRLPGGERIAVHRYVQKGGDFNDEEIRDMIDAQRSIMRSVVVIHRQLQERGQIEVSTTPFYHPILPLLLDTEGATIDRSGATRPPRFAWPEDADAHMRLAVESYARWFGRPPRGMWPAEGAVSADVIPVFARHGIRWIATDQGVLTKSGTHGYRTDDPNVLCQPYRTTRGKTSAAIFFRDTALSDAIGFHYHGYADPARAAGDFLDEIRRRFASRLTGDDERVLTVVLDGENAWGEYRDDARPFLHALYASLNDDREIETVTFSEFLEGGGKQGLDAHPLETIEPVFDLHTGSWIDEMGSRQGVDLGTWIGESEENRGWALLREARKAVHEAGAEPGATPESFESVYIAEGSDWFWWFGEDQDSGNDAEFDDLFRLHLKNVYRGISRRPPEELDRHIVPRAVLWTFTNPIRRVQPGDRLTVRTNCPGNLTWRVDEGAEARLPLEPAGGVMGGSRRYHGTVGPFAGGQRLRFQFQCTHPGCAGDEACCRPDPVDVEVR